MPVPTPPNKDLFKVTLPKPKMRADSKKLHDQIKKVSAELAATLDIPHEHITAPKIEDTVLVEQLKPKANSLKRMPYKAPEHLTQKPFRENDALRKLQYELKKETESKKPVKRTPRRKPANKKTGEK